MKRVTFLFALLAAVTMSFVSAPTKFAVDTKKSKITWIGRKVTGEHTGTINISSGSLNFDGKSLKSGSFEIDMNSMVCTDLTDAEYNKKFIGHLKSDDFFSTAKFSKATFIISSVTPKGNNAYDVTGKLTIKGITNEITFPATVTQEGNLVKAKAKILVDRTKFDIKYGSGSFFDDLGDKAIDDQFEINLDLTAKK